MAFANLTAALNLDISNFSSKLSAASKSMADFASKTNKDYGQATAALKSHNLGLKDTSRIVQGIMVSQLFYGIAGQIREATSALWAFNEALDYAHVTYGALFGSQQVATDFLQALQEHSITTIFDFDTLAQSSKKLLAYGIEYKNLMFIMEGLTNLGAMSGDTAALDRISYALGQIYAKGKLSAEEMRQLANAYVPIQEIIKEKFGLTEDQLGSIGDLNLPAEEVINAIVDYANEQFGGVGDAAMMTITGLKNRIVDTFKVLGVDMLAPVTAAFKSFLVYVATGLENIRKAYKSGGMGGLLEYLVPNESTQKAIRQVVANIQNLFMSLTSVLTVVGRVAGEAFGVFITAFNLITPVVVPAINTLSYFLNMLLQTRTGAIMLRSAILVAAAAFVVLRIQAASAMVITAVTSAVTGLAKALLVLATIITRHPILAMLSLLAVGLVGIAASSEKARNSLSNLMGGVSGATGGKTADDVLQKVEKDIQDNTTAAEQFNQRLEEGKNAAEDLEGAINGVGNAGKKAAGLLSFDEVFKLNETSGTDGAGTGGVMGAIDDLIGSIGGLGSSLGEGLIPEIPDFSEFAADFTDNLFGSLESALTDEMKAVGLGSTIGTILGGIVGGILGGLNGAKLGMLGGTLAGGLVAWLKEHLEIGFSGTLIGAFTGIAKAIAKDFGVSLAKLPIEMHARSIVGFFQNIAAGLINTGLKAVLKNGVIGLAVGFVVDTIAALFFKGLANAFNLHADAEGNAAIGSTIAGILGSLIGLVGGPIGSLIGGAIGTFAGGFIGLLWADARKLVEEKFSSFAKDLGIESEGAGKSWAGALIGGFVGYIISYPLRNSLAAGLTKPIIDFTATLGASIGLLWDGMANDISEWISGTYSSLTGWFSRTFGGFTTWFTDTKTGLKEWFDATVATFTDFDSITSETLGDWWSSTTEGFTTWFSDTFSSLTTWWTDTKTGFSTWRTNTKTMIDGWATDIMSVFSTALLNMFVGLGVWVVDTATAIGNWAINTYNAFIGWNDKVLRVVQGFTLAALLAIGQFAVDSLIVLLGWVADGLKAWNDFYYGTKKKLTDWVSETKKKFNDWKTETEKTVSGWATVISNAWNKLWDPNTWKSGWSLISSWFTDLFNDIKGWFTGLGSSVDSWWGDLWDGKSANFNVGGDGNSWFNIGGHATGGIFDREHIARFAEGNKAEAIIPLENASAMQPFVNAISDGILQGLLPTMVANGGGGSNNLPPMYVGTLIADERGLKELFKKFEVYEAKELARKGLA